MNTMKLNAQNQFLNSTLQFNLLGEFEMQPFKYVLKKYKNSFLNWSFIAQFVKVK